MPGDETTRWTVTVSKETDIAVRSLLVQRGMKKGDLSRFIEDAVRWRVLDQSIAEARKGCGCLIEMDTPIGGTYTIIRRKAWQDGEGSLSLSSRFRLPEWLSNRV